MKKKVLLMVVALTMALAVIGVSGCAQGEGYTEVQLVTQQQGIWVSGTGEVTAVPDVATVSLGVESQQATVAEARAEAAAAMEQIMAALKANGVAEKDIQTSYFNIYDVTNWDKETGQSEIVAYQVTNMVTAKVRDMNNVGAVIDAVVAAGGDLTRVNSISFTVEDMDPYYEEARQAAMTEAKDKAEQVAELAGVKLGKATYITENSYTPTVYRDVMMEAASSAPVVVTPVSPGEMTITLNIQIAYAID